MIRYLLLYFILTIATITSYAQVIAFNNSKSNSTLFNSIFLNSFNNALPNDSIGNYDGDLSGWFSAGLGGSFAGPTGKLSLTVRYKDNLITFRYLKADEFSINPGGDYTEPKLSMNEIGILYGRQLRDGFVVFSASAGLSIFDGVNRGQWIKNETYENINLSTVGVPFEAKVRFEFYIIGIGLSWYGNINTKKTVNGAMVEILIGKFK